MTDPVWDPDTQAWWKWNSEAYTWEVCSDTSPGPSVAIKVTDTNILEEQGKSVQRNISRDLSLSRLIKREKSEDVFTNILDEARWEGDEDIGQNSENNSENNIDIIGVNADSIDDYFVTQEDNREDRTVQQQKNIHSAGRKKSVVWNIVDINTSVPSPSFNSGKSSTLHNQLKNSNVGFHRGRRRSSTDPFESRLYDTATPPPIRPPGYKELTFPLSNVVIMSPVKKTIINSPNNSINTKKPLFTSQDGIILGRAECLEPDSFPIQIDAEDVDGLIFTNDVAPQFAVRDAKETENFNATRDSCRGLFAKELGGFQGCLREAVYRRQETLSDRRAKHEEKLKHAESNEALNEIRQLTFKDNGGLAGCLRIASKKLTGGHSAYKALSYEDNISKKDSKHLAHRTQSLNPRNSAKATNTVMSPVYRKEERKKTFDPLLSFVQIEARALMQNAKKQQQEYDMYYGRSQTAIGSTGSQLSTDLFVENKNKSDEKRRLVRKPTLEALLQNAVRERENRVTSSFSEEFF